MGNKSAFEMLAMTNPHEALKYFKAKVQFTTGPIELHAGMEEDANVNIIDVRQSEDFEKEHIPNAVNLPQEEWESMAGVRHDCLNVLYCYSHVCHLAAQAAVFFAKRGFPVMEMDGGFAAWKEHELPVETGMEIRSDRVRTTPVHQSVERHAQ